MQHFEKEILELYNSLHAADPEVDTIEAAEIYFEKNKLNPDDFSFSDQFVKFMKKDAIARNAYIETKEDKRLRKSLKTLDLV